jgi:hypothetical protein
MKNERQIDRQIDRMARPTGKHAWRSASRFVAAMLLLLISPTLGGCFTYTALTWGPPPPELAGVAVGSSRTEVEERLGAATGHDNNVSHYEFNTKELPSWFLPMVAALDVVTVGVSVVYWGDMRRGHRAQRRHVYIVYGPDDRVAGLSRDRADQTFRDWLHGEDQEGNLSKLCLAARRGDAGAQYVQAMRYRYGLWNTERDSVEALAWLKFAAFSGHPGAARRSEQWPSHLGPAAEEMFQTGGMRSCGDPSGDVRDLDKLPSYY